MSDNLLGHASPATRSSLHSPSLNASGSIVSQQLSRAQMRSNRTIMGNNNMPKNEAKSTPYHRVVIDGDDGDMDFAKCAEMIANIINSRQTYKNCDKGTQEIPMDIDDIEREMKCDSSDGPLGISYERGVYRFRDMKTQIVPWDTYIRHVMAVFRAIEFGPCLSTSRTRLTTMAEKFRLYALLNVEMEVNFDKQVRGGGVYASSTRVDNALCITTSVSSPTLLEYIATLAEEQPSTVLYHDPVGRPVHLGEYLTEHGITNPRDITVLGLGLRPPLYRNKFQPYAMLDRNLNPAGKFSADLLQALLSPYGSMDGDIFGALIRPEFERREFKERQIVATEMQLPLYGQNAEELCKLAAWVRRQGFNSFSHNIWTICIHRSAPLRGPNSQPVTCTTIGEQLRNIFYPMLMATLNPMDPSWADVAALLRKTGSISILTERVTRSRNLLTEEKSPDLTKYSDAGNDYYFFYYIWANLATLNALRVRYGLNTLNFCPSVFEPAPAFDQLVSSFLLADVVYHASSLEKNWLMQYIFMYCRIGVVMSPLRDNTLNVSYFDHPVVRYFKQGLLVSISTSDPLHFHCSNNPLLEEYATLMKIHSLTTIDVCELARNSVLNSNFPIEMKQKWLGENFECIGSQGNNIRRSSLCNYRLDFHHERLLHEETVLNLVLSQVAKKGQVPISLSLVSSSKSAQMMMDAVQQRQKTWRSKYRDRRVVYPRIDILSSSKQTSVSASVEVLHSVISLRKKYTNFSVVDVKVEDVFNTSSDFDESMWEYNSYYGVFLISRSGKSPPWPKFIPTVQEFISDVGTVRAAVMANSALYQLAVHRLHLLERRFHLHLALNIPKEAGSKEEKWWNNRDFFTAHKVDTNVQTAAGMNARTLLEFFVEKALHHSHDVVFEEDNEPVTLRQLLERYNINAFRITVDELNHLVNSNFHINSTFLAVDNFMKGRYFAELTKRTLELYQEDAYSFSEYRLMISGRSKDEWWELAHWFDRYGMASSQNRWMISLPRHYRRLRQQGEVKNFGEYLDNLFQPLWEISLHPAKDTKFHYFLTHVSGMDCIDDESKMDLPLSGTFPHDWDGDLNPPYNLYLYYIWANIASLNEFRASRGLGTFSFRPQCGELGGVDHLIGGFILAGGINHGVVISQNPVLEYLYYITQQGVAMSPLSNTAAASAYLSNPFPIFFRRGLNVSLATNEPLYFHFTREPLIEEYSIAAKLWQFEFNDLSEIARNSVLQSGFPPAWKENALGKLYYLNSTLGNDVRKSRVSDIRVAYRYEVYHAELNFLCDHLPTGLSMPRAMRLLEEEVAIYEDVMKTKLPLSNTSDDDEEHSSNFGSPLSPTKRLKTEIEVLDQELQRMKVLTTQITGHNNSMAATINNIRARLKTEGLIVMGNLYASEVQQPLDDES